MDSITVYALPMDDYLITAEVIDDAISISVELEHEIVLNLFEYPAEITVLSAKISEVEEVATEASSAANTALAAATTAQSSADAAMAQAEAATDMAATNTLSISNILSSFTAWVLGTYLLALTLLDVAIAAGDSIQAMAGKLQGQLNAVKVRLGLLEDDLIYEVLTTVTAASVSISLDKNGNPFSLAECVLYVMNPSWPSNTMYVRVNNNTLAIYNSYANYSITRFQVVIGELGGQAKLNLKYDNDVKSVVINGHNSRIYAGPTFAAYYTNGFTNFGAITAPISRIDILPNTGVIPAGTKIILKKK